MSKPVTCQRVGSARTSTADQIAGLEAQIVELEANGVAHVFREQAALAYEKRLSRQHSL